MADSTSDELLEQLATVAKVFRSEEARLSEHSTTATVPVPELKQELSGARQTLANCQEIVAEQRAAAAQAAEAARNFYETLAGLMRADSREMRGWSEELNSISDASELRRRAQLRDQQAEDSAAFKQLAEEAGEVAELFAQLDSVIDETRQDCQEAVQKSDVMERELEESAQKAEEQRRQEEEERKRRKAEELRRRQEEEERRRREEADRQRQEEEERRRSDAAADERRRAEALDDRNWPTVVYDVEGGEFEFPYGCAVRAPDGALAKDEFACRLLPMDDVDMTTIPATEEVVGNVVQLEPLGLRQPPASLSAGRHWVILLPHCAQRMSARETVVYMLKPSGWVECPSTETHIDGLEHQARWVETRITEPSATVVPVNKLKTDRFSVSKSGIRFTSSVDNRVSVTIPEDAVKIHIDQTLEVQPVDSNTMAHLRASHPKDTNGLLTTSSIIEHTTLKKNALRPVTFAFPLPLNPSGPSRQRPGTAAPAAVDQKSRRMSEAAGRPKTAAAPRPADGNEEDEQILLVVSYGERGSGWTVCDDVELEAEPGKDAVSFRTARICNRRILALRVGPQFNADAAPRLCERIEKSLEEKTACFVLRQKSEDLSEVVAMLVVSSRLERVHKQLLEQGFDHEETNSGREEVKVRERQKFVLRFRGNILSADDDPEQPESVSLVFNSQLKNMVPFVVKERDRFAQRALDQYRGFLDFFTDVAKVSRDAKKGSQLPLVMEETRVASLLITIPKSEEDMRVKSPRMTPFNFKGKDAVTMDYLRDLSEQVSDNWELLAEKLEISRKRCSVIKRNKETQEEQALEMLVTWVKVQQVSKKKAPQLFRALKASGFGHLAEALRDTEQQLQLERQQSARSRRPVRNSDDSQHDESSS